MVTAPEYQQILFSFLNIVRCVRLERPLISFYSE